MVKYDSCMEIIDPPHQERVEINYTDQPFYRPAFYHMHVNVINIVIALLSLKPEPTCIYIP